MYTSSINFGVVVLFLSVGCTLLVPCVGQEANVTSTRVNCTAYGDCADYCPARCPNKTKTLYIQGFVPAINEVYTSETIIPAAFAAIDDINANCSILSDHLLELEFVNTKCDPSEATWQLINSIVLQGSNNVPRIMFLGGGCSLATEPLAALAGRFYKISMLSYGASSPSLSNTEMFPNFFRTIPSEVQSNSARFALMRRYNWTRVATLHETQTIFSQTVENFQSQYNDLYNKNRNNATNDELKNGEGENLILRSFTDDPEIPLRQIKEDKDIRIIMGFFYEDKALATLCRAYKMELTTKAHVWMFPAWYQPNWYKKSYHDPNGTLLCNEQELREAVRYSFFLDSYGNNANVDDTSTDTGDTTTGKFEKKYNCYLKEFKENPQSSNWTSDESAAHAYVRFTYDGVWAMAFALEKTQLELKNNGSDLTLSNFTYFDGTPPIGGTIQRYMMETNFTGVSGEVTFDANGDRRGLNGIYQLREKNTEDSELVLKLIAIHDPRMGDKFNFSMDPLWKGDGPPSDRRRPQNQYLNNALVIFCHFLTTVAVIIALSLLVFNLATLWKPLIRDSAPHINTVVIIGCIVMLVGCYLLGVDSNNPPVPGSENFVDKVDEVPNYVVDEQDYRYKVICNLRLWILTLGFTLSFGALFAKTWQVYRVYTNSELKKKEFKMWNFLIIMGIFLLIDVAYLIFWTATYRFERRVNSTEDDSNDVQRRYESCYCDNYAYLIGALYVYKGLLVVFGLFLAYESRNVKYFYINDSRFVSITMYIVVILVGIGAPLSLVLAVHYFIDPAYGLAVFMIIAACMSCLLILYIPKFYYMAKGEDTMVSENQREEITVSDGLQLGRSTVDTMDVKMAEEEVNTLQKQVAEKNLELKKLQSQSETEGGIKPRNGSDGDSGVLVTGDENETFSTESTANGDQIRAEAGEVVTSSATVRVHATSPDKEPDMTDGTNV